MMSRPKVRANVVMIRPNEGTKTREREAGDEDMFPPREKGTVQ